MRSRLRSILIAASIMLMPVSFVLAAIAHAQGQLEPVGYLPLVRAAPATPTPTATTTPTPTATATPTLPPGVTPTATPTSTPIADICQLDPNPASAPNAPVIIDDIDKEAEVVALKNISGATINLTGWRMCSINGNQEHLGLNGVLAPGQVRSFPYTGVGTIWNDTQRDDGALYNSAGQLIAYDLNID